MAKPDLSSLRANVLERDGGCVWPVDHHEGKLELAHLSHRGMGGSTSRNTEENCVTLCTLHHNCLDGRTGLGTLRYELNELLRHIANI